MLVGIINAVCCSRMNMSIKWCDMYMNEMCISHFFSVKVQYAYLDEQQAVLSCVPRHSLVKRVGLVKKFGLAETNGLVQQLCHVK